MLDMFLLTHLFNQTWNVTKFGIVANSPDSLPQTKQDLLIFLTFTTAISDSLLSKLSEFLLALQLNKKLPLDSNNLQILIILFCWILCTARK